MNLAVSAKALGQEIRATRNSVYLGMKPYVSVGMKTYLWI